MPAPPRDRVTLRSLVRYHRHQHLVTPWSRIHDTYHRLITAVIEWRREQLRWAPGIPRLGMSHRRTTMDPPAGTWPTRKDAAIRAVPDPCPLR